MSLIKHSQSRRLHITIVQGPYFPVPALLGSGVEKMWHGLGLEFVRRGHKVVHLSRRFPSLPQSECVHGVEHRRLKSFDAPKSKLMYRGLDAIYSLRAWKALPPGADVVITNCMWLPIFLRTRKYGALYVHVARYPKGQMWLYRHAARIQTVSAPMAEAIKAELGVSQSRVRVIPPFVDKVSSNDYRDKRARNRTVLYVGRLHPEKGVHLLISAFARISLPDWRLVIVGSYRSEHGGGSEEYFRDLTDRAATVSQRVSFEGLVPQSELNSYFEKASVLVYPSLAERGESFGVVPLEAMARGCPVIVSNLSCFRDYLVPESNGLIFDHHSPDPVAELATVLSRAMTDDNLREALSARGLEKAAEYTLEKIADRYIEDFTELIDSQNAR
jgi:glycosyltransferase involved in cell wall biosynthesis